MKLFLGYFQDFVPICNTTSLQRVGNIQLRTTERLQSNSWQQSLPEWKLTVTKIDNAIQPFFDP